MRLPSGLTTPNPVAMLELPNRYNDIFKVFGNVFAQIKLYKGLSYRVQYRFQKDTMILSKTSVLSIRLLFRKIT